MVRFGKLRATAGNGNKATACLLSAVASVLIASISSVALAQSNQALLDSYLQQIESLISDNNLEGARDKLSEALSSDLRDESLEMIHGQLRLLESLNQTSIPQTSIPIAIDNLDGTGSNSSNNGNLTELDKTAATDLLDSLRVVIENGELDKLRLFTESTPQTDSLLNAVFNNYTAVRVEVTPPTADESTQSFLATLEFKELTTKDGDTAFPAQAWKTHQLRVVKSDGSWQKVLW